MITMIAMQLPFVRVVWLPVKLYVCCHCLQAKEEQEKMEKELRKTTPHFWNLNEDSQLSGKIHHFIKPGTLLALWHYDLQFRTKHSLVFLGFKQTKMFFSSASSSILCLIFK